VCVFRWIIFTGGGKGEGAGNTTVYVGEEGVNVNGYGRQTIRKRMDVSCVVVQLETRFGDALERS